ncbi:COP9 signalosome-like protein complex subunit 4 [Delitschia confertaspora ATCC 74209]|uniref:COP9 signalosome complex subunit 4 n=1 Tax=Delitschia confertaspora ATCC 74209 TaxID=1513339 RepID=A0A9P4MZ19_9PLEO|nr:COP9 signalosome-like protein complex subunit 4 [Delitschia confertaspora ATCC 74209]
MVSQEVRSALNSIETSSPADKPSSYISLLQRIVTSCAPDNLAANLLAYAKSILGDSLGIVASRPLLGAFAEQFQQIKDTDIKVEVGQRVLELLAPKVVSYEEQDSKIKEYLADAYEQQEDFISSAKILQTITLDSSQRSVSDEEKAAVWIRIMRCYLEEDDPTSAYTYLNRVKNVIHKIENTETKLQFKLSQARIYDSQRQFLDASQAYYSLSLETVIDEEERLQALAAAIKCAVLAPAGPQRARMLGRLYKDERASHIEEHGILEKMFLERLISPAEVKAFSSKLQPHHLAKTADGSTVLDKAVMEHNVLGVSRIYLNIGTDRLSELLGIDADRAEELAAKMIEQGRMSGYIDQVDRYIYFQGEGSGKRKTGHAEKVVGAELRKWDANVQGVAEDVEKVTTMIQNQHPDFYASQMENK